MVFDYLITLKSPDYRFVDQVSKLLYVFAILAFGYSTYLYPQMSTINILVIIGIIASWIFAYNKKRKTGFTLYRLGLSIAATGWLFGIDKNIWMAILYAICGIFEKQVKFPQEIGFSKEGISFNTFPKKNIEWNEVANVVIKDGLLTIDQKNNKLFQKEIDEDVPAEMEKECNDYFRTMMVGGELSNG